MYVRVYVCICINNSKINILDIKWKSLVLIKYIQVILQILYGFHCNCVIHNISIKCYKHSNKLNKYYFLILVFNFFFIYPVINNTITAFSNIHIYFIYLKIVLAATIFRSKY